MASISLVMLALFGAVVTFHTMGGMSGASLLMAMLLLTGFQANEAVPIVLLLNIFITISSFSRWRSYIIRDMLWFLVGSVPAAFLAGSLRFPEYLLRVFIGVIITASGLIMLIKKQGHKEYNMSVFIKVLAGVLLGAIAGITGYGGGAYLAILLAFMGITEPKTTAATTTVFVMLNSAAGLMARLSLLPPILLNPTVILAIPVVIISAQLGSYLGTKKLSQRDVKRVIAGIVIIVGLYIIATSL